MRHIIWMVVVCLCATALAYAAYEPATTIRTAEELAKLSDGDLTQAYIDAVVEIEAMKTFHATSGFLPKEYDVFRKWLQYRVSLIMEFNKRELPIPPIE